MNDKNTHKPRIDRVVEDAGIHLASRYSRRSFLGKVAKTAGAALLGGAAVLGDMTKGEAAVRDGCFSINETQVCYGTYRVRDGASTYIFKGPNMYSPVVCYAGGGYILMQSGWLFGRQSLRATAAGGCTPSDYRPAVLGSDGIWWVWGYSHAGSRFGWAPWWAQSGIYQGAVWMDGPFLNTYGPSCGPAQVDFDCRNNGQTTAQKQAVCPSYNGCSGPGDPSVTNTDSYWIIGDSGSEVANSDQRYVLRYAPDSAGIGWLMPGDKIHRLAYAYNYSPTWSCVTAICCQFVPYGCRGWARTDSFGYTTGSGGGCNSGTYCPPGSQT